MSSCSSASDSLSRDYPPLVTCLTSCKTGLWFFPLGLASLGMKSHFTLKRHSPTRYLIHHLHGKATSRFLPACSHPSLTPQPLHLHRCEGGSRSGGFGVGPRRWRRGDKGGQREGEVCSLAGVCSSSTHLHRGLDNSTHPD